MTIVLGNNYLGLNTDNVSVSGPNVGLYTLLGNSFFPFKNRIINGEFNVNQRNNARVVNNVVGRTFGPDRWGLGGSTAGAFSAEVISGDIPDGYFLFSKPTLDPYNNATVNFYPQTRRFQNCIEIKSLSNLSINSVHSYDFFQNIEGRHVIDMDFGNSGTGNSSGVTRYFLLSFFMKTSLGGYYTVRFEAPGASTYRYSVQVLSSSVNTWSRYCIPVPVPTSQTWNTNQNTAFRVNWCLGAGSSISVATPGVWQSTSHVAVAGSVNLVSTLNATIRLTGIQLEYIGNLPSPTPSYLVPSDFQTRSWQTEYELCLRYYQKSWLYGTNAWTSTNDGNYIQANNSGESTVPTYNHIRWPGGPMRSPPTVTLYGLSSSTPGRGRVWNGSATDLGDEAAYATAISATGAMFYISPITLGNVWMTGFHWVADAEPPS